MSSSTTEQEKVKDPHFKKGDIVPYITTAGTMKWTKISDFKETGSKNNFWHVGNDTVTGAKTFYPDNYSFNYLNALKEYHAITPTLWIDPEKERPKPGDQIIAESDAGLFWGFYESTDSGKVAVQGRRNNKIYWDTILRWIRFPVDFPID